MNRNNALLMESMQILEPSGKEDDQKY